MSRYGRSVSAETRKITATKTWWILGIALALYAAMMTSTFAFLFGSMADQLGEASPGLGVQETANTVYSAIATYGYVVPFLVGALSATGELRHRTLALAFIAEPSRGIVLLGKVTTLIGVGAVLGIVGVIGGVGAGAGTLALTDADPALGSSDTWALLARIVAAMAIWAVIGFGVGVLVRNQAMAIVLALVFTQFLEPLLRAAASFWDWSANVARFLPGSATDTLVGASTMTLTTGSEGAVEPLTMGAGALVLVAYAVVAVLAGWALRWNRDLT